MDFRRPNTSKAAPENKIYSHWLRGVEIIRSNQVWASDIIDVLIAWVFIYIFVIVYFLSVMFWRIAFRSRWRRDFCVEVLEEALLKFAIKISMDGKGALSSSWRDNIFVGRLWPSMKYEEVYLKAYDSIPEASASLARHVQCPNNFAAMGSCARDSSGVKVYNAQQLHSSLDRMTPGEAYFGFPESVAAA